ncbi:MAG: rod shape-determining protein RodA [Brevinematia bacterium]
MFKDLFKNVETAFILIPLTLSIIGMIFVYSTGINPDGTNSNLYIKQLIWFGIGLVVALLLMAIDYYRLVEISHYLYIIGIILLIITLIFGKSIRGSKSWLGIGGLGIQPSEIMKIFYILFFAKYLSNAEVNEKVTKVFLYSLGILVLPLLLILIQPDLGTSIVFVVIFIFMIYIGIPDSKYIKYLLMIGGLTVFLLLIIGFYKFYLERGGKAVEILDIILSFNFFFLISLSLFLYSFITMFIDFFTPTKIIKKILPFTLIIGTAFLFSSAALKVLKPYQWKRILVMINPEFDSKGAGYNIIQSTIAIGSGGVFGKGLFRGSQNTLGFLPEKNTDFIFSIICEELGFIGSTLILLLFGLYFYNIFKAIRNTKDKEGMLVATGILAMFFTHFLVNIGMTLGITPATGLPLPFISYGGSSLISFMCAAAIMSNIYSNRFIH